MTASTVAKSKAKKKAFSHGGIPHLKNFRNFGSFGKVTRACPWNVETGGGPDRDQQ